MKKLVALGSAFVSVLSVSAVGAQQSVEVQLPPGYVICRAAALAPNAPPLGMIPACATVDGSARKRLEQMQKDISSVRNQADHAQKTADEANKKSDENASAITGLTDRVGSLETNSAAQSSDIAGHEVRLQKLEHEALVVDWRLDSVETRLGNAENRFPRLQLRGGLALISGAGGDSYAGFPVTAELLLPVAPKYSLSFEGGTSLSFSDNPFGVVVRLGLDYRLSDKVHVGSGVSAYGVGLDSSLDSAVMFTGLDARFTYRLSSAMFVGAAFMPLGANVASGHDVKYAFGGTAFAGLTF